MNSLHAMCKHIIDKLHQPFMCLSSCCMVALHTYYVWVKVLPLMLCTLSSYVAIVTLHGHARTAPVGIGNSMVRQATSSVTTQVLQAAGVYVKGFAASLDIMQQYRVCLAPLRYGAGLKGKIMDSWAHGLPVCTTPIGAEGMCPATCQTPEGFPDTQVGKISTAVPFTKLVACNPAKVQVHIIMLANQSQHYLSNLLMSWFGGSSIGAASKHVWCKTTAPTTVTFVLSCFENHAAYSMQTKGKPCAAYCGLVLSIWALCCRHTAALAASCSCGLRLLPIRSFKDSIRHGVGFGLLTMQMLLCKTQCACTELKRTGTLGSREDSSC